VAQILTIGNLALFWGTVFAIPYTAWSWVRTHDWRAGFVVVPFLVMWLPWFVVSRPQFFFYVLPMTPFMALAATYTLRALSESRVVLRDSATGEVAIDPETGQPAISTRHPFRPIVVGYLAVFVILFVWFWPLLVGSRLTESFRALHIWMRSWN
jgi:dolichyl-phosphate-mannose--protein O-mannosyl transferase